MLGPLQHIRVEYPVTDPILIKKLVMETDQVHCWHCVPKPNHKTARYIK